MKLIYLASRIKPIFVYVTDDGETQLSHHTRGWGLDLKFKSASKLRTELIGYGLEDEQIDELIQTVEAEGYAET